MSGKFTAVETFDVCLGVRRCKTKNWMRSCLLFCIILSLSTVKTFGQTKRVGYMLYAFVVSANKTSTLNWYSSHQISLSLQSIFNQPLHFSRPGKPYINFCGTLEEVIYKIGDIFTEWYVIQISVNKRFVSITSFLIVWFEKI